ncbi:MAG: hypothetical protein AAB972_04290 [Patescibacteria group bacterium]
MERFNEFGNSVERCHACGKDVEIIAQERGGSKFFDYQGGKFYHPWCWEWPLPIPFAKTCTKCGGEVKKFSVPHFVISASATSPLEKTKIEEGYQCVGCGYSGSYLIS